MGKCYIGEMLHWGNVTLGKCYVGEMLLYISNGENVSRENAGGGNVILGK